MDAKLSLQSGRLQLGGGVHFDNADRIFREGMALLPKAGNSVVVDLSELDEANTVVVAILLQWLRASATAGQHLRIEGMTDKLRAIVRVSGLQDVFPES